MDITKFQEFEEVHREWLKNPKYAREYKKLEPQYTLISALIGARIKKKMTQQELAKKVKTKQSAISRLEAGNSNPTVEFLEKIAAALDSTLQICFKPKQVAV